MTNWKTTLTGSLGAITAALTAIAALPYSMGDIATMIPPEYKAVVFKSAFAATIALRILNAILQKDGATTTAPDTKP